MNFYELDNKVKQHNKYRIVAKHIVENKIDIEEFLNNIINEESKPGFFQNTFQNIGTSLDKFKGSLSNMWSRFRGNPTNVNSVVQILEKVREFLSKNPSMQKAYDSEISGLAKTIEKMKNKISGTAVPESTPDKPIEATPESSPETPTETKSDPKIVESYLKRLTYGQPVETIDSRHNKENYTIYANELASYSKNEIENVKNKLMKDLMEKISHIEENGININGNKVNLKENPNWDKIKSQYLIHETWALWDIGKQLYLSKNPSKSGAGYRLGNPLTDEGVQKDSVNRMVGWACMVGAGKGNKFSSLKLIEIGEKAIEGNPID